MGEVTDVTTDETTKSSRKPTQAELKEQRLLEIEAKIAKLEQKQKVIKDGFEYAGNELRPLYGFGAVALIFDAINKKLGE